MSIGEDYRQQMVAARQRPHDDDDTPPLEAIGRGIQTISPVGAIKVAVERDDARVLQRLKVQAAAAGGRFYYSFPVTNKDGSKSKIEGPSIDCALAVARSYGNCDVDVRVEDHSDHWIFLARFRDFETGFTLTRAFQQRKNQVAMKTKDPGRALDMVFQIGQSKAIRNVICNALSDFTDFAFEEARAGFVDRVGKRVDYYREKAIERLAELKIDVKRVEAVIGKAAKDWLAQDLARIIAEIQAIQDGMSAADETYPLLVQQQEGSPVDEKEPVRETAPKAERAPRKPRQQKPEPEQSEGDVKAEAEAGGPEAADDDGATEQPNPEQAIIADGEARAAKLKSLTDLAELDQEITTKLDAEAVDPDAKTYWRGIVTASRRRITGQGE